MNARLIHAIIAGLCLTALFSSGEMLRADDAIGSVNGEPITRQEFDRRLHTHPVDPTIPFPPPLHRQLAATILNHLVSEHLVMDLARKEEVLPTQEQIDQRKRELSLSLQDRGRSLEAMLNDASISMEEMEARLKTELARSNIYGKFISLSEEEVKIAYDQATVGLPEDQRFRSMFYIPASAHVYVIITDSKESIDKAHEFLEMGISFSEVVKQTSEDENTKARDGELGLVIQPDEIRTAVPGVPPEIYEKTFATPAGTNTEPFMAAGQWVILRVEEANEATMQPYDHVSGIMRDRMLQSRAAENEQIQALFEKARSEANVKINLPHYSPLFDQAGILLQPGAGTPSVTPTP